ncbi:MAG TPA: alanine racemase [Vicinamibacterales bacterium]|nr:alanine racemase [Vicinamibacterales bacterium]
MAIRSFAARPPIYTATVTLANLRTPAVLIDVDRLERNLDRMQAAVDARRIRLRPHAKTHKALEVARMQVERGAAGICCAKLGEAEVFARAGIADIRLPYPLHPSNADRVAALLDATRLSFIVDDLNVAREWSAKMRAANRDVDVLVKVDVGFHRCGIDPERADAAEIVARIAELPGLRFRGLLSHAGHGYGASSDQEMAAIAAAEARVLATLAASASALGVEVEEISVGATPTARFSLQQGGITEMRPGNYAYYDRTQVGLGAATWADCALTVFARVVSTPADDRIILDSGSKTLTNDLARGYGSAPGYGAVFTDLSADAPDPSLLIERLSEEHATVRVLGGPSHLRTGDLVRVVPNHSCVVSNLVDSVWMVRGDEAVTEMAVAARGRIA